MFQVILSDGSVLIKTIELLIYNLRRRDHAVCAITIFRAIVAG